MSQKAYPGSYFPCSERTFTELHHDIHVLPEGSTSCCKNYDKTDCQSVTLKPACHVVIFRHQLCITLCNLVYLVVYHIICKNSDLHSHLKCSSESLKIALLHVSVMMEHPKWVVGNYIKVEAINSLTQA